MPSITLPDRRLLSFAEYGDPRGTPVFLFHGMPGSRLFRPFDEITLKLGVRLITVDRPGYGLSTFQPHRSFLDWPSDLSQLADALKIDKFAVISHSGGGPYVAACAYALPGRLIAAGMVSPPGPVDSPGVLPHLQGLNRFGFQVGRSIPWPLWQSLIWMIYKDGYRRPEVVMEREAATRPHADAELWKDDRVRETCYASTREAFRPGTKGHAWEARLITRSWDLPLEKIAIPIHLWHGTADRTTPVQMVHALAQRIPDCLSHFFDDEAHLLIFPHWEEILSGLLHR